MGGNHGEGDRGPGNGGGSCAINLNNLYGSFITGLLASANGLSLVARFSRAILIFVKCELEFARRAFRVLNATRHEAAVVWTTLPNLDIFSKVNRLSAARAVRV